MQMKIKILQKKLKETIEPGEASAIIVDNYKKRTELTLINLTTLEERINSFRENKIIKTEKIPSDKIQYLLKDYTGQRPTIIGLIEIADLPNYLINKDKIKGELKQIMYSVTNTKSPRHGDLIYKYAVGYVSSLGTALSPDPSSITTNASKAWDRMFTRSRQGEVTALDMDLESKKIPINPKTKERYAPEHAVNKAYFSQNYAKQVLPLIEAGETFLQKFEDPQFFKRELNKYANSLRD